jgi:hypothetical protein
MKTIANRLIVFAASTLALGATAFGQSPMTASIPFAFHAGRALLPAGNYEINEVSTAGAPHLLLVRNTATLKGAFAGNPLFNVYRKTNDRAFAEFVCRKDDCTLKAIRTSYGSLEYATPRRSKDIESSMAVISLPLKPLSAD